MSDIAPYIALVGQMCLFWRDTLSQATQIAYARVLSREPLDAVRAALDELALDAKVTRFPLPAVVLDRIRPQETDEQTARQVAARILSAIGRFGWTNPERAREYVGEAGWKVVEMQGGWALVCQTVDQDNATTFQAQWRELAVSILRRARSGTLDQAPGLSAPKGDAALVSFGVVMKALTDAPKGEETHE